MADEQDLLGKVEAEAGSGTAPDEKKETENKEDTEKQKQEDKGGAPSEEGQATQIEKLTKERDAFFEGLKDEKGKRQKRDEVIETFGKRLDNIESLATKIEQSGLLAPGKTDENLTDQEKEARRLYDQLRDRLKGDLFKDLEPKLKQVETKLEDSQVEQVARDFQTKYGLSNERLEQVMDYAEAQEVHGPNALEISYKAMIADRVIPKYQTTPEDEKRKEEAGKTVGTSTAKGTSQWFRPYDPEKDRGKPLSVIIDEAKQEYLRKTQTK